MGNLLESLSVVLASVTAVYGIFSWRAQLKGTRKYEVAEEVFVCVLEYQEAVRFVRSSIDWGMKKPNREKAEDETPRQSEDLDKAYTAIFRLKAVAGNLSLAYAHDSAAR